MKTIVLVVSLLFSASLFAAASPSCFSSHGGYCTYDGFVKEIYVNEGGLILMYFEAPMTQEMADVASMPVANFFAGAIQLNNKPEFAKLFYSTALSAQATDRKVTIQLRGVVSGYPKIDRIWLAKE